MTRARREFPGLRAALLGVPLMLCVVVIGLLAPPGVLAEIFKCKGPDGNTVYTSDPSACPGAKPHELKTDVQTVVPSSSPRRPAVPRVPPVRGGAARGEETARTTGGDAAGGVTDSVIEMWRRKRPEAEAKLAELKKRAAYLHSVVGGCNRGSTWYAKDEAGLKHHVSCDELRSRSEKVNREIVELEAYLAGGLEEECRRSGCLPGWVR